MKNFQVSDIPSQVFVLSAGREHPVHVRAPRLHCRLLCDGQADQHHGYLTHYCQDVSEMCLIPWGFWGLFSTGTWPRVVEASFARGLSQIYKIIPTVHIEPI